MMNSPKRLRKLKRHPVAKLFPSIEGREFIALKADIERNGVRLPILLYRGMILDGANRARACAELGIACPAKKWDGKQPWLLAQSANLLRRHLDEATIALIYLEAAKRFPEVGAELDRARKGAEQRMQAGRKAGGKNKATGARGTRVPRARSSEVARRLGCTLTFIYHLLYARRLPGAKKVGRNWEIPESVITERLKAREQQLKAREQWLKARVSDQGTGQ